LPRPKLSTRQQFVVSIYFRYPAVNRFAQISSLNEEDDDDDVYYVCTIQFIFELDSIINKLDAFKDSAQRTQALPQDLQGVKQVREPYSGLLSVMIFEVPHEMHSAEKRAEYDPQSGCSNDGPLRQHIPQLDHLGRMRDKTSKQQRRRALSTVALVSSLYFDIDIAE